MALCKYPERVGQSANAAFDRLFAPGELAPHPGIYQCVACGDEIASERGVPLPPSDHHEHKPGNHPIHWKLLVYADTRQ